MGDIDAGDGKLLDIGVKSEVVRVGEDTTLGES